MTIEPEDTTTKDLTIEITVRNKRTMSQYRLNMGGKINFKNAHEKDDLVVTPKYGSPFVDTESGARVDRITVPAGCTVSVGISLRSRRMSSCIRRRSETMRRGSDRDPGMRMTMTVSIPGRNDNV